MSQNINLNGNTIVDGYFSGIGENLTDLNASNLTTGTVADDLLSDNVPLLDANNVWTGSQKWNNYVATGEGTGYGYGFIVNSGGGEGNTGFMFQTSEAYRWQLNVNSQSEAGSNTGSDLSLSNYNDAGALIGTPLKITRATGVATFNSNVILNPTEFNLSGTSAGWYRVATLQGTGPNTFSILVGVPGGQSSFTVCASTVFGGFSLQVFGMAYLYTQFIDQIRLCLDGSGYGYLDIHATGGVGQVVIRQNGDSLLYCTYEPSTTGMTTETYTLPTTGNLFSQSLTVPSIIIGSSTPSSSSSAGVAGTVCWDANYIYVCTATNTWKRTALETW